MTGQLSGKTAIVTGASSGIGRAIAQHLGAEGATVYLVGRSQERLDAVKADIEKAGGKGVPFPCDVRELTPLQAVVDKAVADTGGLHIMVNGAGLEHGFGQPFADSEPDDWREMVEVNILALLMGSKAAINAMRKSGSAGHIVNIGSVAGRREASGVYGATKAFVNSIGTTMRQELENDPIRVVQILPGAVLTNFGRHMPADIVNGLLSAMGVDIKFETGQILPDELIEKVQAGAKQAFASADDIARAVMYAVTQPTELNVYEIEVRPQMGLRIGSAQG